MAFAAGVYTVPSNSFSVPVTGTTISSTAATALWDDLETALTTCILKDGTQTQTANIPMATFILTGLGAGTANGHSVRWQQTAPGVLTTTGDVLYASSANTPARLAIGTARQALATNSGATAPEWVASLQSLMTATGDIVYASSANTPARLAIGTAGQILTVNSGATANRYVSVLNSTIYGLTYSNNGVDATNDIDIAVGGAISSANAYWMTLASAITKQSDVAWAVGTNAGGLDTGAVGNSDYYIHLIARSDTGVVDVLFSLSSTAPTMPTNYDYRRLIGWFKRVGGTIVAFTTYETEGGGIELAWNAPTLDIDLANTLTTSRRTDAVKVPLNFSTIAHLNVQVTDATTSFSAWIACPDTTDAAPSSTVAPLSNMFSSSATGGISSQLHIRTSATGTIAARANLATVDLYAVVTLGFAWARRN